MLLECGFDFIRCCPNCAASRFSSSMYCNPSPSGCNSLVRHRYDGFGWIGVSHRLILRTLWTVCQINQLSYRGIRPNCRKGINSLVRESLPGNLIQSQIPPQEFNFPNFWD